MAIRAGQASLGTGAFQFVIVYPGGRMGDARSSGCAFFANFFSDLGQITTNLPSMVLFCIALVATAFAVGVFFVAQRLAGRLQPCA